MGRVWCMPAFVVVLSCIACGFLTGCYPSLYGTRELTSTLLGSAEFLERDAQRVDPYFNPGNDGHNPGYLLNPADEIELQLADSSQAPVWIKVGDANSRAARGVHVPFRRLAQASKVKVEFPPAVPQNLPSLSGNRAAAWQSLVAELRKLSVPPGCTLSFVLHPNPQTWAVPGDAVSLDRSYCQDPGATLTVLRKSERLSLTVAPNGYLWIPPLYGLTSPLPNQPFLAGPSNLDLESSSVCVWKPSGQGPNVSLQELSAALDLGEPVLLKPPLQHEGIIELRQRLSLEKPEWTLVDQNGDRWRVPWVFGQSVRDGVISNYRTFRGRELPRNSWSETFVTVLPCQAEGWIGGTAPFFAKLTGPAPDGVLSQTLLFPHDTVFIGYGRPGTPHQRGNQ